jgi:hypothetical protein
MKTDAQPSQPSRNYAATDMRNHCNRPLIGAVRGRTRSLSLREVASE